MSASPSGIKRMEDVGTKTAQANHLIADIVPLLDGLNSQGLAEVRAYLDAKLAEENKSLSRETTRIYRKGISTKKIRETMGLPPKSPDA